MKKQTPFNIFVLAVFIGLIVPLAIQDGMFMDGQIYAAVSHNLANGYGTFWFPTFSKSYMAEYSEQLPLFFGVQGIFFKLFGSSMYTERIFSFIMALITAYNIILIWKLVYQNEPEKKEFTWIPVFFWIMVPVISWSYIHNVEEVLMSVFATGAVYFILKGLILNKNLILNLTIGGVLIFLTSFCKGFQGLFPLVTIAFYWLFFKKISFKNAFWYSIILTLVPLIIYGFLFWNDTSFQSIENYYNNRLVRTFTKSWSATTNNRFSLLIQLFEQLIPVFILMALFFGAFKRKMKGSSIIIDWKKFGFFLSIGLSGSLPLMVTLEQRGFYLTTSLPFTALALAGIGASFIGPVISQIDSNSRGLKIFRNVSIICLVGVIALSIFFIGHTKRNETELHDVYLIGEAIPKNADINISMDLNSNYALRAYFVRHFHIDLDADVSKAHPYYLMVKGSNEKIPEGYELMLDNLIEYDLYKKVTP